MPLPPCSPKLSVNETGQLNVLHLFFSTRSLSVMIPSMSLFSFCLIVRFLIVRMPCWPFVEEATLDIFLLRTSTFLGPPPPPKSFLSFGLFLLVWLLYFLCTLEENVVFFFPPNSPSHSVFFCVAFHEMPALFNDLSCL